MIALVAVQAEEAFFEDRIAAVPHSDRKANVLMAVADAGDTVLVPPIRPGPGVVMRQKFPGGAFRAIVLADGSPGPLGKVRPPALPVCPPRSGFFESEFFACHRIRTD